MKERTPVTNSGLYAIQTRYVGPTDTTGSYIEVTSSDPSDLVVLQVPYDHSLDIPYVHAAAAVQFANTKKSDGYWREEIKLVQGSMGQDGYVFVLLWE